jgi:hypothetical protein
LIRLNSLNNCFLGVTVQNILMGLDKRAVSILKRTFWSTKGWRRDPHTDPDDLEYAKSHGVMFDPISISHDDAIQAVENAVAKTSKAAVVEAFVASLSTRRLELRSSLGTYAVGRNMRAHPYVTTHPASPCNYCGDYDRRDEHGLSILNFERIKWGGVRHDHPIYIGFDLQTLPTLKQPLPTSEDFRILRAILEQVRNMPETARPTDLDKALGSVVISNSSERRTLIGILGFAGILVDPSRPNFLNSFVPVGERERTHWHRDDWPYPVQWWRGGYGLNENAVNEWFPMLT